MDISKTALVFQGLQVDFCDPAGKLYPLLKEQIESRGFMDAMFNLLDAALERGIACYNVPIEFHSDYREIARAEGILGAIRDAGALVKDTPGAEPIERLKPYRDRITVMEAKRGLCGFGSTDLDQVLRNDGIETVVVAGLLTNVCVETTARSAYDLGYQVITVKDATATTSAAAQAASEDFMFPLLGSVITTEEFLASI